MGWGWILDISWPYSLLVNLYHSPWRAGVDLEIFLALFTALRLKVGFWTIFEISCRSDLMNFALFIFSIPK